MGSNIFSCVKKNKSMEDDNIKPGSRRKRIISDGSDSDYNPEPETKKRTTAKTKSIKETKTRKPAVKKESEPVQKKTKDTKNNLAEDIKEKKPARSTKKITELNEANEDDAKYDGQLWDEAEILSNYEKVSKTLAQNFISLLEEGCTLAFIARYRKTHVDYLMPDK